MKQKIYAALTFTLALGSCDTLNQIASVANVIPTTEETIRGLKEALNIGIGSGVNTLSVAGAFLNNPSIKILFPPEITNVETKLRAIGMGAQVDKAINALNEGAENAVGKALPIFGNAISNMSIDDAMGVLKGGNGSATSYLKKTTSAGLTEAFKPVIKEALDKVGATKYWTDLMTAYNLLATNKVNTDLNAYVTEKAMGALFAKVEVEENAIRADPLKRSSEILKKVFNYADTQK